MGLWVCEIIWCWWQISKRLWCIGRLILATDSWRTEINLSHCHSTIINTRQTDLGVNPTLCTDRLLPDYLSFLLICFDKSFGFYDEPQILPGTNKLIRGIYRQLAYLWCNCWQSIHWESIWAIMHYTTIVIQHSETGDCACVIFIKIVFIPWWRTEKLLCIFTVFTEPHNNTILYCCSCWKFGFLAV